MSDLLRTRGLLRAERLSADRWRSQAERYARLLARDRFALARVKAGRDAALAEVRERRAAEARGLDGAALERAVVAFLDARPRETDMDDMTGRETWEAAPHWWRDTRTRQMRAALTAALGGDQ